MSNHPTEQQDGSFKQFIRGFWELPLERPNYYYSFLRGAIVSVVVSIFTQVRNLAEIVFWAIVVGLIWAIIDHFLWKHYAKRKGE